MKIKINDFLSFTQITFLKRNNQLHRINKPASIVKNKDVCDGEIHIEHMYYQNNQLHCITGPAMKCSGCKRDDLYYIDGMSYISKESWLLKLKELDI